GLRPKPLGAPKTPLFICVFGGIPNLFVMRYWVKSGDDRKRKADNNTVLWNLEFSKIRYCEALKNEGAISFIKPLTRLLPLLHSLAMTEF
ncbi:MAG: hypothetical protein MR782_03210, partial [Campylobacter sp.]|nr:hypothetical protein [Campylobacter sp.]